MSKTGKNFWGPPVWHTIHSTAASYKPHQRASFKRMMNTWTEMLPCDECRGHLKENLKRLPVDNYLDNNHNLFLWTYFLHDLVNKQLGKHSPPYKTVKEYYFKGLGPECTQCSLK